MPNPQKQNTYDDASISAGAGGGASSNGGRDPTATVAAFSPPTLGRTDPTTLRQRSTILVHQKSPLLVATPPQVTRTLAYSYPFIAPLNRIAGLLTWTSDDPWESFLLLTSFWAITLYGDPVMRWGGPVVVVILLILGMYSRRFSTLSSTATAGAKGHHRTESEAMRHAKSLDEIVDNLKLFTSRCNILLDPFLRLTDFLSTQRTATSATTRPALTVMFVRILLVTPIWILLTLPPFYVVTTKRLILFIGTVTLTWHCRPARVLRTILWRSRHIRRATSILTGLQVAEPHDAETGANGKPKLPPRTHKTANDIAASLQAKRRPSSPGIRFTFTLYENQRRWLLLGWTSSMLAYERGPWTDEHLNAAPAKEQFDLPDVEGGHARWRWVEGSEWHVDLGDPRSKKGSDDDDDDDGEGWIYYDNKWKDGRRGRDSWGRYTRRRKWCRDAELVEVTPSTEPTPSATPAQEGSEAEDNADGKRTEMAASTATIVPASSNGSTAADEDDESSINDSTKKRNKGWFRRRRASSKPESQKSVGAITTSSLGSSSLKSYPDEEDEFRPSSYTQKNDEWTRFGDDIGMQLG